MKKSAGILLERKQGAWPECFLVHPGGPFYARRDEGWWTIPKGEFPDAEPPLEAALREFEEETGYRPPGPYHPLAPIVQRGGKRVYCWVARGDFDSQGLKSNTFLMQWPPGSGQTAVFPEVDRGAWFTLEAARRKILPSQLPLLAEWERLASGETP